MAGSQPSPAASEHRLWNWRAEARSLQFAYECDVTERHQMWREVAYRGEVTVRMTMGAVHRAPSFRQSPQASAAQDR